MLEEVLKQINENLGRIADALCTNTNVRLDSATVLPKVQNMTIQTTPLKQVEIVQSDDMQSTITTTTENIQATVVPVNIAPQGFTQEQLAVAMSNAVAAGKMQVIQSILQQLGVQALTQVKPEDYNKLATMLKEQGVEV